jgi:hypothetical protein
VDEQEHPAGAEGEEPSAAGAPPPVTEPAIPRPEQRRRGEGARKALTSRGAGWVAAAILAGAVVALSVVLATGSSTTVLQPVGAARSFRLVPGAGGAEIVPFPANAPASRVQIRANGPLRTSWVEVPANAPLRASWVEVPANAPPGGISVTLPAGARPGGVRVEVPAVVVPVRGQAQVPPGRWVEVPARVWIQVPAGVVSPAPTASPAKSAAH